jgi:hypothetical protein
MRFVLVNERTVRASTCTYCSTPIGLGYLREMPSRQVYCDYACYTGKKPRSLASRPGSNVGGLPISEAARALQTK